MKSERLEKLNNARIRLFLRMTALILLVALYLAMPVYAWFYQGRTAAAAIRISNPTSIHVDAANSEDIRYLDLSGIDVESNPEQTYADYVFSISGHDVVYYMLQLAYTTNNQFEYELYHASLYDGVDAEPTAANSFTVVTYTTHPPVGEGVEQKYYVESAEDMVTGTILNRDTTEVDDIILAYDYTDATTKYHDATYDNYENLNKYAEPIYWQTTTPVAPVRIPGTTNFCDYYVLRVIWTAESKNDKETDIIYIAAKNVTGGAD